MLLYLYLYLIGILLSLFIGSALTAINNHGNIIYSDDVPVILVCSMFWLIVLPFAISLLALFFGEKLGRLIAKKLSEKEFEKKLLLKKEEELKDIYNNIESTLTNFKQDIK